MPQARKKEVLAQVRKRRRNRALISTVIAGVLIVLIIVTVYTFSRNSGPNFPFPCLPQEAVTLHVHPWLQINITRESVTIPTAIGIQNPIVQNGIAVGGSCFESLHTHDSSGIIHIESPDANAQYTLGDFFHVWNVTHQTVTFAGVARPVIFNKTDILGFRADPTHAVVLLVDGNQSSEYELLNIVKYDYCNVNNANVAPCSPTAGGDPYYGGNPYPFGTGHTLEIEYRTVP